MQKNMIGIIGAGNVGKALGKAFAREGQEVCFGLRNPEKYRDTLEVEKNTKLMTVDECIEANKIIVMAMPYQAALQFVTIRPDWNTRILVDVSTPLSKDYSKLEIGLTTSGAEEIQKLANNARIITAFSTMSAECMENSNFSSGKVFMPVCGNDNDAREKIIQLAKLIGFDAIDAGSLRNARYVEPMAMLWVELAIKLGYGRNIEFSLLRR